MKKKCYKCNCIKNIKSFSKDKSRKDGFSYRCKLCDMKYRKANKKVISEYQKEYIKNNKVNTSKKYTRNLNYYQDNKIRLRKYQNEYIRNRCKNDLGYKISRNLRRRINLAIKENNKSNSFKLLLGCSIDFFKKYLESNFKKGMSWNNYGYYGWHVDHIIPCCSFDLSKEENQLKCFHYSNLQPLWAKEKLSKGSK